MIYDQVNNVVLRGEAKFGRFWWIIFVSVALMILASIYVRPGTDYIGHGKAFESLTNNPFGTEENFAGYRIMTPLISYLVGLRGRPFILVNLFFAAVTIGFVYSFFRKRAVQAGDSLVATACLTFSTVILVTIFYAGFCDALTYLAIFLMWRARSKPVVFYLLFVMGILNHESVVFLIPWFAYLRLQESPRKSTCLLELLLGFGLTLTGYMFFREWIASRRGISLSADYYLIPLAENPLYWIKKAYLFYGVGLFSVFKALWVFPLAAGISMWRNGCRNQIIGLLLPMVCAASQLIIAYDTTRMLTVGFMTMVIALIYLFKTDAFGFRKWAVWVILSNFLIPQLFTASNIIEIMRSTPVNILRMIIENRPWW